MDIQAMMANHPSIKRNEESQPPTESKGMHFNQLFSSMIASNMKETSSKDVKQDTKSNDLQDDEILVQLLEMNGSDMQEMKDILSEKDAAALLDWFSMVQEENLLSSDASTEETVPFQNRVQSDLQAVLSMLTEEKGSAEKLVEQLLSGQKETDQTLKDQMQALTNRDNNVGQDIKSGTRMLDEQLSKLNQAQNQAEITDTNLRKETLPGMFSAENAHEQKNISLEKSVKEQLPEIFGERGQDSNNAESTEMKEKLLEMSAASNTQKSKETSDKAVFDTTNIMMKLKALSQSGANSTEETDHKQNGEKSQQPIADKISMTANDAASPKLSSDDPLQHHQSNDHQSPILQSLEANRDQKSNAEGPDAFKAAVQESVDLASAADHTKAHESLAQLGSKVRSHTLLIKNMDAVQMAMNQQISKMGDKEKSTLTVKLQPEELGKMKIELELKDNVIQGKIYVENESAKNALQQQMQTMRDQMKTQGISVESLEVDIGSESFQDLENQQETLKDSKFLQRVSRKTHSKSDSIFIPAMDYDAGSTGENRLNAFA